MDNLNLLRVNTESRLKIYVGVLKIEHLMEHVTALTGVEFAQTIEQLQELTQVKAITRELKKRGVPENKIKDNIHNILHDEGMDYQEALEEALNYFGV